MSWHAYTVDTEEEKIEKLVRYEISESDNHSESDITHIKSGSYEQCLKALNLQ